MRNEGVWRRRGAVGCGASRRRRVRRDGASRPTAARVAAAIPVGPKHKICS